MKEIRITCWGHACFGVSCGGKSILFDPYQSGSVPGVELPADLTYDRVYCSHGHGDHNARERVKETSPDSDPFPIRFLTVPHDDANGAKRGMNRISIAEVGGAAVVHMGDIGRLPTEKEYEELCKADILMIPAGGFYTIDAVQAKEIIDTVKPDLAIIMHYRLGDMGYDVLQELPEIQKTIPGLECVNSSSVVYEPGRKRIIAMTPVCREGR
ncbi:MAG: MBL fold metallo-hydrolase [Solobacterium sp.]|nr:MBL fold metallo-hydrolase [Solobacterium sp.]